MNKLKQLKTIQRHTCEGPAYAILMVLDLYDPVSAREFVFETLEKFKLQWMIGPPQTTHLLVTLMGEVSADEFISYLREKMGGDPVLRTIMSLLREADVWRGSATGEMIEQESLLQPV
ncbi:MAG TPA: hypothetical protein PK530_03240 [Anaerolineales bacterium]|nr:hypothetical protein [Anaerolineales bacterium]